MFGLEYISNVFSSVFSLISDMNRSISKLPVIGENELFTQGDVVPTPRTRATCIHVAECARALGGLADPSRNFERGTRMKEALSLWRSTSHLSRPLVEEMYTYSDEMKRLKAKYDDDKDHEAFMRTGPDILKKMKRVARQLIATKKDFFAYVRSNRSEPQNGLDGSSSSDDRSTIVLPPGTRAPSRHIPESAAALGDHTCGSRNLERGDRMQEALSIWRSTSHLARPLMDAMYVYSEEMKRLKAKYDEDKDHEAFMEAGPDLLKKMKPVALQLRATREHFFAYVRSTR
jgi:hypothetical protein